MASRYFSVVLVSIKFAEIHDFRLDARTFTLRGTGDEFVSDVIGCLSENRIHVTDFRTVLPSLEDVFLALTGHSIRD